MAFYRNEGTKGIKNGRCLGYIMRQQSGTFTIPSGADHLFVLSAMFTGTSGSYNHIYTNDNYKVCGILSKVGDSVSTDHWVKQDISIGSSNNTVTWTSSDTVTFSYGGSGFIIVFAIEED